MIKKRFRKKLGVFILDREQERINRLYEGFAMRILSLKTKDQERFE